MVNNDADILFMDSMDLVNDTLVTSKYSIINYRNINTKIINVDKEKYSNIMFGWACWRYLIKKEFIIQNDIKFGEGSIGEDIPFNSKIYQKMNNIIITPQVGYYHRVGTGISKNKYNYEIIKKYCEVYYNMINNYHYGDIMYKELLYYHLVKGLNLDLNNLHNLYHKILNKIPQHIWRELNTNYRKFYESINNMNIKQFNNYKEKIKLEKGDELMLFSYIKWMKKQKYYYNKWYKICKWNEKGECKL